MSEIPNIFNQQMNMNNIQPNQPLQQNFQFQQNEMMNTMQYNQNKSQSQLYQLRQQQLNQNQNINLNNFNNMNNMNTNMNNQNLNMGSNKPKQNMNNMTNITFDNLDIKFANQNQPQNINLMNNMNKPQKNLSMNSNIITNYINNAQPEKEEEDEKEESPHKQNPNMNMNNSTQVPKMNMKEDTQEIPTKKLENKFSFLYRIDENVQYPAQKTVMEKEKYESQVKKIAEFDTIEEFWGIFQHLRKPDSCRPGIEYFMFKEPIKPMWEDENNKNGGRFSIKLKHGYTTIIWEEMIFALIGGILPKEMKDEINGIVVTSRKEFNTLQIWFKTYEEKIIKELEQCIRDLLVIPSEVNLDTKPFNKKEYGNNNKNNNNNNNNNKSGGFQYNNRGYNNNNNNNNNYGGNYYNNHRKNKNHAHKNNK